MREFLERLILVVAPPVAEAITRHVFESRAAQAPDPAPNSFAAYVRARR